MNREQWLNAFTEAARPVFAECGHPIPDKVRVSLGFPSKGGAVIGQCWSDIVSGDGHFEIFIHPSKDDPSRVCGILTHELIHAAVGLAEGHKGLFKKMAHALGLEGKMTATTEGEHWHEWADPIISSLGDFPHAALSPFDYEGEGRNRKRTPKGEGEPLTSAPPSQTNRHIKLTCSACGAIVRTSRKTIESAHYNLRCIDAACDGILDIDSK